MVAHFLGQLDAEGAPDDLLAPVMIVMALSAALAGILLFGLGLVRAGSAIRFVPYPVVGGFLGATGWLMVNGAARVVADKGLSVSNRTFLRPPHAKPGVKRLDAPDVGCFVASTIEFVLLLEVQPEFWGGSERLSEAYLAGSPC